MFLFEIISSEHLGAAMLGFAKASIEAKKSTKLMLIFKKYCKILIIKHFPFQKNRISEDFIGRTMPKHKGLSIGSGVYGFSLNGNGTIGLGFASSSSLASSIFFSCSSYWNTDEHFSPDP